MIDRFTMRSATSRTNSSPLGARVGPCALANRLSFGEGRRSGWHSYVARARDRVVPRFFELSPFALVLGAGCRWSLVFGSDHAGVRGLFRVFLGRAPSRSAGRYWQLTIGAYPTPLLSVAKRSANRAAFHARCHNASEKRIAPTHGRVITVTALPARSRGGTARRAALPTGRAGRAGLLRFGIDTHSTQRDAGKIVRGRFPGELDGLGTRRASTAFESPARRHFAPCHAPVGIVGNAPLSRPAHCYIKGVPPKRIRLAVLFLRAFARVDFTAINVVAAVHGPNN